MLAKNIIRINGYKNGKRSHVDVEVKMTKVEFKNSSGELISVETPSHIYDPAQAGFDAGLDGVTSMNMYNWVSDCRITTKVD